MSGSRPSDGRGESSSGSSCRSGGLSRARVHVCDCLNLRWAKPLELDDVLRQFQLLSRDLCVEPRLVTQPLVRTEAVHFSHYTTDI